MTGQAGATVHDNSFGLTTKEIIDRIKRKLKKLFGKKVQGKS